MQIDLNAVQDMAKKELLDEDFRKQVEREKERIKFRRNFWIRLFPWRLRIERRDDPVNDRERVQRLLQELQALECYVSEWSYRGLNFWRQK